MSLKGEGQKAAEKCRPKKAFLKPIKKKGEFEELFKRGRKTTQGNLAAWHYETKKTSQLAVIMSAKDGRAVKRNRARRITKEIIKQNTPFIKQGQRMAIKINAPLLDNYQEAQRAIIRLLKKAGLIEKSFDISD